MNLLAIIIVFLAIVTAGAIAYIAWELSSGDPVFRQSAVRKAEESAVDRSGVDRSMDDRSGGGPAGP